MSLQSYLDKYLQYQENILLVSRTSLKSWWGDRCSYKDKAYIPTKHYNHRSILFNEIVIEFDHDDLKINKRLAEKVADRLSKDKITYMIWHSGNKSYHLHTLVNTKKVSNLRLLKKKFIQHYTEGLPFKPDLQVAADSHLIRAEFGIHEKTNMIKTKVYESRKYFRLNTIPKSVWQEYSKAITTVVRRRISKDVGEESECTCLKYIGVAEEFRENQDGCERALFVLIHTLKKKYKKDELQKHLWEWYRYAGGHKLSEIDVFNKVNYHYNRHYGTYRMVEDLLVELGKEDVLKECPLHSDNSILPKDLNKKED